MANTLPFEKKVSIIHALCEDMSIRAVERITGVHRDTIMRLGVKVGEACAVQMDGAMRNIPAEKIQVDEIWGFIGKKQATKSKIIDPTRGDVWTFIAIDPETKLIPSYLVGSKRDMYHATVFMEDLASRLANRVQLSSDGLNAYPDAVDRGFGNEVDYGQIVKTFSVTHLLKEAAGRYSPAKVARVERFPISGSPMVTTICTSHVEKQNHTLRMHCRRLTRLTNAFSKKLDNFKAAVALNFFYYNFVKIHSSIRMTPAMAAGICNEILEVKNMVEL